MTEQTILLLCLFCALAATLGLYLLKAAKQTAYRGDERWQTIQLKADAAANATNWLLLFLLLGASILADGETTFTLNGMGQLYYQALRNSDYELALACQMFYCVVSLVGALIMDLSYGLVDPRVRVDK